LIAKALINIATSKELSALKKKNEPPQSLHFRMLGSVLEFMKGTGLTESAIRDAFEEGLGASTSTKQRQVPRRSEGLRIGNENLSAELLRMWHRDDRFIDSDAKPKPLPLSKGRSNLASIILRIDPDAKAEEILREMRAVNLIRRVPNGKFLPTSEAAIVSRLHPLATDHIAKLVIRLVSTVSRNLNPAGSSLPLVERHAYAPDLSWVERKAFAEFTRAQGMVYLESVDNWLQQRRVSRLGSRTRRHPKGISASVHLFAYLGDDATEVPAGSLGSPKRNLRGRSSAISRPKLPAPTREAPA
jgi:hypothetical protein